MKLTQDIIKELLFYNYETKKFYWKSRDIKWFKNNNKNAMSIWNNIFAGKEAGTFSKGFLRIKILNKIELSNRLLYIYEHDCYPENGHRYSVSGVIPSIPRKNNTTGYSGVKKNSKGLGYEVHFPINEKMKYFGLYKNIEDAINKRKEIEINFMETFITNKGESNG